MSEDFDENMEVDQFNEAGFVPKAICGYPHIREPAHNDPSETSKDRLLSHLDRLENRVEELRKEASRLEEEKDNIMSNLDTLKISELLNDLNEFEKDDIQRYVERITSRCQTIDVKILTSRDITQEDALYQVNRLIDNLVRSSRDDPTVAKTRLIGFLNACSEHTTQGAIDKNFETALLGCTLDDQKVIKKRLQGLMDYFNKDLNLTQL